MKRIGIRFLFSVLSVVTSAYGYDYFDDLDHLGDRISANVQRQVQPLQGLGARINQQVQRNLNAAFERSHGHFNNLNADFGRSNNHFHSFPDLGSRISDQVEQDVAPLQNLGDRINAQVQKNLEPVRALEIQMKMKNGVGGVTLAEHSPSGRIFVIRNNQIFACNGRADWNQGRCIGTEEPFAITKQEDWCFARPGNYARVNDRICLSLGTISVSVINNVVSCQSSDNRNPVFSTTIEDFRKMCQDKSQSVTYKYFADPNNPISVKIPNANQYIMCKNQQANVCEFDENHNF